MIERKAFENGSLDTGTRVVLMTADCLPFGAGQVSIMDIFFLSKIGNQLTICLSGAAFFPSCLKMIKLVENSRKKGVENGNRAGKRVGLI